jgi:hypothetical protein
MGADEEDFGDVGHAFSSELAIVIVLVFMLLAARLSRS